MSADVNIKGGPIELSGYDTLDLPVDHLAILPDGGTVRLPAGTKLVMHNTAPGITGARYSGKATKLEALTEVARDAERHKTPTGDAA